MRTDLYLGAILAVAAPAAAQDTRTIGPPRGVTDTGAAANRAMAIRPDIDTPDGLRAYSQMLAYGRCISGLGRKPTAAALNLPLSSAAEQNAIADAQVRLSSCVPAGMPRTITLVRGAISEGLYHKVAKSDTLPAWQAGDSSYSAYMTAANARTATLSPDDQPYARVADCVVAQNPALADKMLDTKLGSTQERDAFTQMFGAAKGCGVTARPASISTPYLRAFVANSAYRMVAWKMDAAGK